MGYVSPHHDADKVILPNAIGGVDYYAQIIDDNKDIKWTKIRKRAESGEHIDVYKREHWFSRDTNAVPYHRSSNGMSEWHQYAQQCSANAGHLIEWRVPGSTRIADAYDPSTNTIYEYVHSHFDEDKIYLYKSLGYNQYWIFDNSVSHNSYYSKIIDRVKYETELSKLIHNIESICEDELKFMAVLGIDMHMTFTATTKHLQSITTTIEYAYA